MKKIGATLSCLLFVSLFFFNSSSIGYVQGINFNSCFSPTCSQYQLTTGYIQSPLYLSSLAYLVPVYSEEKFFSPAHYYIPIRWPFFNGSTIGSYTNSGMDFNSANRPGNGSGITSIYSGHDGFGASYASNYSIGPLGEPLNVVRYAFTDGIDLINQYHVFPPGMYTNNFNDYNSNRNDVFSGILGFMPEMENGFLNVPVFYGTGLYSSVSDNGFGTAYAGSYVNSPSSQSGNRGFISGGFALITPFGSLIPFGSPGSDPQVIQPDSNIDSNIITDPNITGRASITGYVTIKVLINSDDSVYIKIASEGGTSTISYEMFATKDSISQILIPKYSNVSRLMVDAYFSPSEKTPFASLPLDLDDLDDGITLVLTVDVSASPPISIHEE